MCAKVNKIAIDGPHRVISEASIERTPKGFCKTERIFSKDLGCFVKKIDFDKNGNRISSKIEHLNKDIFIKEAGRKDVPTLMKDLFWKCDEV